MLPFILIGLLITSLNAQPYRANDKMIKGEFDSIFASPNQDRKLRIAIVDTGISEELDEYKCKNLLNEPLEFSGDGSKGDQKGHGTKVAKAFLAHADDALKKNFCFISVKVSKGTYIDGSYAIKGLAFLDAVGVDAVNISFGGTVYSSAERAAITKLLDRSIMVAMSAGNKGKDLSKKCDEYPACYFDKKGARQYAKVVTGYEKDHKYNTGGPVNEKGPSIKVDGANASGTSFAAPSYLAIMLSLYL